MNLLIQQMVDLWEKDLAKGQEFEMPKRPPRLLVFAGNPTQYHAPLFRQLSKALQGRLFVMFGGSCGLRPFYNPEIKSVIKWDVPTVGGYPYKVFKTLAPPRSRSFFRWNNPGMIGTVLFSSASHVLIHGYDTVSSFYVYFSALISGKKIIWRGETVPKLGAKRSLTSLLKRLILPLYLKGVEKVLWSCLNNRDYLASYLGRHTNKLVRFPCAVDNAFFGSHQLNETEVAAARAAIGLPSDHMVIATCSRLTKRKRTYLLIDAIACMSTNKVTLLVIGDGPERGPLEDQARRLGVSTYFVGFVGQVKVAKLLALSDVFSLLSFYDASPKALNEAMNFPLAMVASTGVGTARDLVRPGVNGYLFETGEEDALVNCLEDWANDPCSRRQMGGKNDEILRDYTIEEDVVNLLEAMNG